MALRFTVLASGSSGNASLVEADGFGVLLDAGLGPRQLAERLQAVDSSWSRIHALLLTHTHSDHWQDRTLAQLHRRRLPLYCHIDHARFLARSSPAFADLHAAGLIQTFQAHEEFSLVPSLRCRPLPVRHDCGATFGFRLEAVRDLFGLTPVLAYLADLGCWDDSLVDHLADLDVLALEFNHDIAMQYASGRPYQLVERILGDEGHLSNVQAADLVRAVLRRSTPGRLKHVVQLHLSRECNRPTLAVAAAQAVLAEVDQPPEVHTARQHEPGPILSLGYANPRRRPVRRPRVSPRRAAGQPWLPGLENA